MHKVYASYYFSQKIETHFPILLKFLRITQGFLQSFHIVLQKPVSICGIEKHFNLFYFLTYVIE